jgi:hypothetical protein
MVRRVLARIVAAAIAVAAGVGLVPVAASAAPKPPRITAIQIAGDGLPEGKVVVAAQDRPQLFRMMLNEVSWLALARPSASTPKRATLGPKYTVTLLAKNAPQAVYDLYPLAKGGPRAHRAAKQPTGKKADGWFYGRLTMSESLRLSGAPLKAKPDVVTGGIGGGAGEDVDVNQLEPPTLDEFFAQMRQLLLLNGAVLVVILCGLGGIAFLIRRRV